MVSLHPTRSFLVAVGILAGMATATAPLMGQGKSRRFKTRKGTNNQPSTLSFQPQSLQSSNRRAPSNLGNGPSFGSFPGNSTRPGLSIQTAPRFPNNNNSIGRVPSNPNFVPRPGKPSFPTFPNVPSRDTVGPAGPTVINPNIGVRPLRPDVTFPNLGNNLGTIPGTLRPQPGNLGRLPGDLRPQPGNPSGPTVINNGTLVGKRPLGPLNLGNTIKPGAIKPGVIKPNLGKTPLVVNPNAGNLGNVKPQLVPLGDKLADGKLNKLLSGEVAGKLNLTKQLELKQNGGDVALQLGLKDKLAEKGGWAAQPQGKLMEGFADKCFEYHCGWWPGYYPGWCYYPHWCGWVDWCWGWDWHHHGIDCWDPRPIWCQPIVCEPCPTWIGWDRYPAWQSLPHHVSGTWVDVLPAGVATGSDLQLLAIRFVDAGHPEKDLGARYRVMFRNNSDQDINKPFNILLLAGDSSPHTESPYAGFQIETMEAGETKSVDIRLPLVSEPYKTLHVLVDSHKDIAETEESNNGTSIKIADILPVDPVLFGSEDQLVAAGSKMSLAGEGLGPEPGRVIVHAAGLEWEAAIEGWTDLGARIEIPALPLADHTPAEIVLVRGDGAVTNPLSVTMTP